MEVLDTDCCWIQIVTLGSNRLPVAGCRGFTRDMRREISSMELGHSFSNEIVGLGHKVIIPDLSRDGNYNIPFFERAGFQSLIAVPIMTYRIHGIMGAAYRARKKFGKDFAELLSVVASLIGACLNKSMLYQDTKENKEPPGMGHPLLLESRVESGDDASKTIEPEKALDNEGDHPSDSNNDNENFQEHVRLMRTFNQSHKAR